MKLNEFTVLEGSLVYLVPYEEQHVYKYHEWMKTYELQKLTASEPLSLEEEFKMQKSWREDPDIKDEVEAMIGDTNIFLNNDKNIAEIEIMIAESSERGKGLGKEAVMLMLQYGVTKLNITTFKAIILKDNVRSIALFEKIGFHKVSENKVFNELIFEKEVNDEWIASLQLKTGMLKERQQLC